MLFNEIYKLKWNEFAVISHAKDNRKDLRSHENAHFEYRCVFLSVFVCLFVFFRIKRGGALCIWPPCTVDSRDPRYWFKMVIEELHALLYPVKQHRSVPLTSDWFPSPCACRRRDWLCWQTGEHPSSPCCQMWPRAAHQLPAVQWCWQDQVSLAGPYSCPSLPFESRRWRRRSHLHCSPQRRFLTKRFGQAEMILFEKIPMQQSETYKVATNSFSNTPHQLIACLLDLIASWLIDSWLQSVI